MGSFSSVPDASELLAAYDTQLRAREPEPLPDGVTVERDGPLLRFYGLFGPGGGGFVSYRALGGIEGAALDELIARQVRAFAARNQRFEWKVHGHDLPPDLTERLRAAGFVPEDEETVVIASVDEIASEPRLPEGVSLREVTERPDFERIAALEKAVWGEDGQDSWLVNMLDTERTADPDSITIIVVEAADTVVCAGWIRFERGTEFGTLWGGSTLPEWRRRGIYRATVAYRANLARQRGFRFLEVDASSDSRPILERLGFVPVTTTTPYIWSPQRKQEAAEA
jgi:GNAT superfamily N-acetyltransferase